MGDMLGHLRRPWVLAALYQRRAQGQGSRVDVALLDSQIALLIYRAVYIIAGEIPVPAGSGQVSACDWGL